MEFIAESFEKRFVEVMSKKEYDLNDTEAARDYVNSMLEFELFSHKLYNYVNEANLSADIH